MKKRILASAVVAVCCLVPALVIGCSDRTEPEHVHSYGEWTTEKAATCTESGTQSRKCACGEVERKDIDPLGHDYGPWQVTVTEHSKECSRCSDTVTQEHNFGTDNVCAECDYTIEDSGLEYEEITDEAEGEIIGYRVLGFLDGEEASELIVPAYHNGLPVTEIAEAAFSDVETIERAVLFSPLETLGRHAFSGCTALKSVRFGDGLKTIDEYAFYASGLEAAVLPDGVETVGKGAFYMCPDLTSAVLGPNVSSIGNYAFYKCTALPYAEINGAEEIGDQIFQDCSALKSVKFGSNVNVTLGNSNYMFYGCSELEKLIIDTNGLIFDKSCISVLADNSLDVVIGDSVTAIPGSESKSIFGYEFYESNKKVRSITVGKNVKTIGDNAFVACEAITEIILHEGLTSVGQRAFYGCSALERVEFPVSLTDIGAGAFGGCTSITSVVYGGTLGQWASLSFPNTLSNPLSGGAAAGNKQTVLYVDGEPVQGAIVIDGTSEIGAYAFYNYCGITEIVFSEDVNKIGYGSFAFGSSNSTDSTLETIVIMSKEFSAASGGGSAFNNNSRFVNVYYNGTMEDMINNVKAGGGLVDQKYDHVWFFENRTHYFYSDDGTEEPPEDDGYAWSFGGYWHFGDDGQPELWESEPDLS